MGIFRREQADVQQPGAAASAATAAHPGQLDQQARLMPRFASAVEGAAPPGVVPPPAAPIYSMRPAEAAARAGGDAETFVAEKVRMAMEAQQSVRERVRVAVQRTRTTASPAMGMQAASQWPAQPTRHAFDPERCAQAGLLKLAWRWRQAGAPIRAIHTYVQVVTRYPDTPAAAAAVADLVELSDVLAEEGHFHIALGIYDQLEELL